MASRLSWVLYKLPPSRFVHPSPTGRAGLAPLTLCQREARMGRPRLTDAPTVRSTVRFSPREWAQLDAEAEKRGVSRAACLRELLRELGLCTDAA